MAFTTPATEIEAVNEVLATIGEAPINTLSAPVGAGGDVTAAINRVARASRKVQASGWWFNTETRSIAPDVNGEYILPTSTLSAKVVDHVDARDYVARGSRLYNTDTNRYDGHTDTLEIKLILALPFDGLPEEAREYIAMMAARKFGDTQVGATFIHQVTLADEQGAGRMLRRRHVEMRRANALRSPRAAYTFRRHATWR